MEQLQSRNESTLLPFHLRKCTKQALMSLYRSEKASFRSWDQTRALDVIEEERVEGGRELVVLPTGAGKSLFFLLSAMLQLPRLVIGVSFLKALLDSHHSQCTKLGLLAHRLGKGHYRQYVARGGI